MEPKLKDKGRLPKLWEIGEEDKQKKRKQKQLYITKKNVHTHEQRIKKEKNYFSVISRLVVFSWLLSTVLWQCSIHRRSPLSLRQKRHMEPTPMLHDPSTS